MEKDLIVKKIKEDGFCLVDIDQLSDLKSSFFEVKRFMEDLILREDIVERARLLKEQRPIVDRTKFFEFQNHQLLGEGLSLDNSPILQFYLKDLFLDVAEDYLETDDVKIRNCLAFYHPENPFRPTNSQNWHRDTEDRKILKAFVYCNDVGEENGSLWYVKNSKFGSRNDNLWPNVGHAQHGYLDLNATQKIPKDDIVSLTGKSGTICFFDANGFHKGGSVRKGYRISTHCCFLKPDAPHIINKILPKFDYNSNVNTLDKESKNYLALNTRQKKVLQ